MKKFPISVFVLTCFAMNAWSQAAWIEPENPDVTKTIRIYCDLSKVTNTSLATETGPFYIWTWKPTEAERVDTLQNGTTDKPWKSSNERLMMTKDDSKGARVYYYEMVPTVFYNCTANDVYTRGISFLVKPKDGGGFGDPDKKTEDLNLVVNPPKLNRGLLYSLPAVMYQDAITSLVYDNPLETKATMKDLADGDVYIHMIATITDTTTLVNSTLEPAKFFQAHNNPRLRMRKMGDGRFRISMIPEKFFNVPGGSRLTDVTITVRKAVYNTAADQTDEKTKLKYGCQ